MPSCRCNKAVLLVQPPAKVGMFRIFQAFQSNKLHQRSIGPTVPVAKPYCSEDQRNNQTRSVVGLFEEQLACYRDLKEHRANDNPIAYHHPPASSRMLEVVHGIEQLVFVDEKPYDEMCKAGEEHHPRIGQNAIHQADDENQDDLRKVEPIAKDRRLYELREI